MAGVLGDRRFAAKVWPGLGLILLGAWGGWLLSDVG